MTRWQRPVRLALLLAVLVVVAAVAVSLRPRVEPAAPALPETADPEAVMESSGALVTQASGVREDYAVEYARRRTYEDGTTLLDQVVIRLQERADRDFEITANEAQLGDDEARGILLRGDVVTTASDGLRLETETAEYHGNRNQMRAPGDVAFTRGTLSGTGRDVLFQERQDVLLIRHDPVIELAADGEADPLVVTAGRARIARAERQLRFQESVRAVQPGQIVDAGDATLYLQDAADTMRRLELRGEASIAWPEAAVGALDRMAAQNIDLDYAADGRTLDRALLEGGASLSFRGADGAGRRLLAARIDLDVAPDGVTLVSLDARGDVELTLPPTEGAGGQRIRAAAMTADGTGDTGLTAATFSGGVEFREAREDAASRVTTSRTLDAALAPTTGELTRARFAGEVAFTDGPLSGAAPEATYDIEAAQLALRSPDGSGVHVSDVRMTIDAASIDLGLESSDLTAEGDVRSVLKPRSATGDTAADSAQGGEAKLPAILEADRPVNVTAQHLELSDAAGTAVYTGDARLWQGETAVQADTITLYEETGDLGASGNVRSTMRLEDAAADGAESSLSVATAENLLYEDARHVATYTRTARVIGPQGDLRAARIELYLDETGGALERAEAYDEVALDTDRRSAAGTRLTYFVADERYVMSGAPVLILEQLPQECRETLGKTLTFYRSTDTISVDGNEQSRTQTRSGERCPEPPVP